MNIAQLLKTVDAMIADLERVDATIRHVVIVDDEPEPAAEPGELLVVHHIVGAADLEEEA
jgi:hypothetical protein